MSSDDDQRPEMEAVETKRNGVGKAAVKPRHLSPTMWQIIVEQFMVRQSTADIAEELGLPVRTVDDVIKLALLRRGPNPAPMLARRIAA